MVKVAVFLRHHKQIAKISPKYVNFASQNPYFIDILGFKGVFLATSLVDKSLDSFVPLWHIFSLNRSFMDLHAERQCIDGVKGEDMKKFMLLFDAYFDDIYKYVKRRVGDGAETERITRVTFLEAINRRKETPRNIGFEVWLYSVAKPKVWEYINEVSFPRDKGIIFTDKSIDSGDDALERTERMLKKMSLEEREILRLKFFEEVSDGDVMTVLNVEEASIGVKIYRVLKRAHFLLFGESDEKQGIYFGELSGFLSRIRELEKIGIPGGFKLSLRADIDRRISRRDAEVEMGSEVDDGLEVPPPLPQEISVAVEEKIGSDDPAKIFVEAVREMKKEEREEEDQFVNFIERWRNLLILIPVFVFAMVVAIVVINFVDFGNGDLILRGYPTTCEKDVNFYGVFSDGDKRAINKQISNVVCDKFDVENLQILRRGQNTVEVSVDIEKALLEYTFVRKNNDWEIKRYEKIIGSDEKPGKIYRNSGGS